MEFCGACFYRNLPQSALEPGKYRVTLRYSGKNLRKENFASRHRARLRELYKPDPVEPLPVDISLNYTASDGTMKTQTKTVFVSGDVSGKNIIADFVLKEKGTAPFLKVACEPDRSSLFFVEELSFE